MPEKGGDESRRRALLRRADQAYVAALLSVSLVVMAGYFCFRAGHRGGLVEIESVPRRPVRFLADINTALWPELAQLLGIGEALARRIVASRNTDGSFLSHNDVQRVSGIGPKIASRISSYLLPIVVENVLVGRQPRGDTPNTAGDGQTGPGRQRRRHRPPS